MVPVYNTNVNTEVEVDRSDIVADQIQRNATTNDENSFARPLSRSINYRFDESQCLFCNEEKSKLDDNLTHMAKAHGLYINPKNLLVDIVSLLAHFHLIVSGCYECLYCGTQRSSRQGVQQHMMAKGHCKFDVMNEDSEIREFYKFPSDAKDNLYQDLPVMQILDGARLPSQARSRIPRPSKHSSLHQSRVASSPLNHTLNNPASHIQIDTGVSLSTTNTHPRSLASMSTKTLEQKYSLNNQLARFRADDRRSLMHFSASQQRALLATQHKQMEKATRVQQTNRANLENAGNKFRCLGKIRLIRKPPHTGNIHSLNR